MFRYVDLTLNLEPDMRGVFTEVARDLEKDGWNATTLHLYSHCGTHMDAPLHFGVSKQSIDEIPVDQFFVDCYVIDLTGIEDKALICIEHLGNVAKVLKPKEGLLFKTDWSKYVHSAKYRDDLPRISRELAEWCALKGVGLIGVEPPSIADVNNIEELTTVHEIILEAGIMIVEGLTNLGGLTKDKVHLVALPLKVRNGDGAPARVVAIER